LSGSFVVNDVLFAYNRLFVIGFAILIVFLTYLLLTRTSLGLQIRAVMQNRTMAASLGVSTRRIDMLTFGLGSGLAGMAGCALTQVGGVTPDMGQNYVIAPGVQGRKASGPVGRKRCHAVSSCGRSLAMYATTPFCP